MSELLFGTAGVPASAIVIDEGGICCVGSVIKSLLVEHARAARYDC